MDNNDLKEYIIPLFELISNRFKLLHMRAKSAMEKPDQKLYVRILFEKASLLIGLPSFLPDEVGGLDKDVWEKVLYNINLFVKEANNAVQSGGTAFLAKLLLPMGDINIENNSLQIMLDELKELERAGT